MLNDSDSSKHDKISAVLAETPIQHRNRLLSDLLSFLHFLFSNSNLEVQRYDKIKNHVETLDTEISEQIFSKENIEAYPQIFSDALKAIAQKDVVLPFHLIPYTWTDNEWTTERNKIYAGLIQEILAIVNEICE